MPGIVGRVVNAGSYNDLLDVLRGYDAKSLSIVLVYYKLGGVSVTKREKILMITAKWDEVNHSPEDHMRSVEALAQGVSLAPTERASRVSRSVSPSVQSVDSFFGRASLPPAVSVPFGGLTIVIPVQQDPPVARRLFTPRTPEVGPLVEAMELDLSRVLFSPVPQVVTPVVPQVVQRGSAPRLAPLSSVPGVPANGSVGTRPAGRPIPNTTYITQNHYLPLQCITRVFSESREVLELRRVQAENFVSRTARAVYDEIRHEAVVLDNGTFASFVSRQNLFNISINYIMGSVSDRVQYNDHVRTNVLVELQRLMDADPIILRVPVTSEMPNNVVSSSSVARNSAPRQSVWSAKQGKSHLRRLNISVVVDDKIQGDSVIMLDAKEGDSPIEQDECIICAEEYRSKKDRCRVVFGCDHMLCTACVVGIADGRDKSFISCPYCRVPVNKCAVRDGETADKLKRTLEKM